MYLSSQKHVVFSNNSSYYLVLVFCSIDGNTGMMSADLRVIASGVYEFECKVIDMYIADTRCAFQCNVAGGTPTQVETCKDSCRERAEAISTVKATIKTIEEAPVWNGASIRLKGIVFVTLNFRHVQ